MILTVANYKGGVAKTTTAVHLAAYLARRSPTLLIDGDSLRSATKWARRGAGADGVPALPFRVIDEKQAARYVKDVEHVVIDTQAGPSREDLEALVDGCDLLVIPTTPEAMALDAVVTTARALKELKAEGRYRVLLTMVPPRPSRDGEDARAMLSELGLPLFAGEIRRLSAFTKASAEGVSVDQVADRLAARAWAEYEAVGKEILP